MSTCQGFKLQGAKRCGATNIHASCAQGSIPEGVSWLVPTAESPAVVATDVRQIGPHGTLSPTDRHCFAVHHFTGWLRQPSFFFLSHCARMFGLENLIGKLILGLVNNYLNCFPLTGTASHCNIPQTGFAIHFLIPLFCILGLHLCCFDLELILEPAN